MTVTGFDDRFNSGPVVSIRAGYDSARLSDWWFRRADHDLASCPGDRAENGLRSKLIAQEELSIGRLGEVGSVLRTVAYTSIGIESTIALVLTPRFLLLGENLPTSLWHGIFYAISSFNNAGFTPHSDGLVPYGHDFFVLAPVSIAVFLGALGFPVLMTISRNPSAPATGL